MLWNKIGKQNFTKSFAKSCKLFKGKPGKTKFCKYPKLTLNELLDSGSPLVTVWSTYLTKYFDSGLGLDYSEKVYWEARFQGICSSLRGSPIDGDVSEKQYEKFNNLSQTLAWNKYFPINPWFCLLFF